MRSLAGILLRRTLDKHCEKIPADRNVTIRQQLLALWKVESNTVMLKRLSHILAQSSSNGDWKDLLPSLITQHDSQPSEINKSVALISLIEIVTEYSPDDIQDNLATIGPLLEVYEQPIS